MRSRVLDKKGGKRMDITTWFDPSNPEHIVAYKHLEDKGVWPEGFIPDGMEFSPSWHACIAFKIVKVLLPALDAEKQKVKKLLSVLRKMIMWTEYPAIPLNPNHICGPEGNCDTDCEIWADFCKDLATAKALILDEKRKCKYMVREHDVAGCVVEKCSKDSEVCDFPYCPDYEEKEEK